MLVLLVLLALRGAYMLGFAAAGSASTEQHVSGITNPLGDAQAEISILRNALEVERKRHELDERALELVRSEIATGSQDRAALQEQLRFYRALMAPGRGAQSVSIRPPELVAKDDTGKVAFSVLVQQKANKHQRVRGTLTLQVKGMLAGQEVLYPVSELTDHLAEPEVELQFRYFQALEGELALPPNFEPTSLEVSAQITKPKKWVLDESFPWELQEKFTHVGK